MTRKKILAVVGATASGKTELGLDLAKRQDAEIISVDSRQVYRGLSVGTAKPKGQWTAPGSGAKTHNAYLVDGIPYHLVDIWEPDQAFTAAHFVQLASERINDILSRNKTPILIGGTGLYFKALTEGLAQLPPADPAIREELRDLAEEKGRPFLHAELAKVDPLAAQRIPANNIQRVMRALEVYRLTGKAISAWHQEHQDDIQKRSPRYDLEMIGIEWSREELYLRIEQRCEAMLDNGMIEEAEELLGKGFAPDCPALTGLGYPRIVDYISGRLSGDHLCDALIGDTRQYAKRQMTWFRNQCDVKWTPWKK